MNLASIVDPHPAERAALVSRGKVTTYGELRDQVARLRGGLLAEGVSPGDRVALLAANNWYFVSSYLAVLGIGAVAVPLNPASPAPAVQRELKVVGARLAITGPTGRRAIAGLDIDAVPTLAGVVTAGDLLENDPAPVVDREADDVAVLLFTSGTAGAPRAAMLTHGNLMANIEQVLSVPDIPPIGEVALAALPFFHVFGLNAQLGVSLAAGMTVVLMERFDAHAALEAVAEHGITVMVGVPTMWSALANLPGAEPSALAGVHLAISGAAELDPAVARLVLDRLGVTVYEGYGLTEASPIVSANWPGGRRLGSVGKPLPQVKVLIDHSVGPNSRDGEIVVYGPNIMQGYHNLPEETAQALTADGGLRTGDLGYLDKDGFLFVTGRLKEQYRLDSGRYVVPSPLEHELAASDLIQQVMLHGDGRPYNVALIVPNLSALRRWADREHVYAPDASALLDHPEVRAQFGREIERHSETFREYEKVRGFALLPAELSVEAGMLTPSLKIRRRAVAERYAELIDELYGKRRVERAAIE